VAYVRIAFEHRVDVIRELGSFVLVNRMADVGIRTLNSDLACLCCQATGRGLHFGMELRIVREYSVRIPHNPVDNYLNPILEFDLAACINTNVLQGLPGEIVIGTAGLDRSEDLGLIDAARLVRVYRTAERISVNT
jgi:hypothetical protein